MNLEHRNAPIILKGVGVSPGIAIAPAYHFDNRRIKVPRFHIDPDMIDSECERFKEAVSKARDQIKQIMEDLPDELKDHASLLQSHLMMLKDKMLFDRTLNLISKNKINAEWALEKSLEQIRDLFKRIKDPYIRERIEDVEYVAKRVLNILAGDVSEDLSYLNEPVIVVAKDLSPADTTQMNPEFVKAFITDMGSRTSHTAIIARSLGIPAVVGLESASTQILSGEILIVDGISGEVIISPDKELLDKYEERRKRYIKKHLETIEYRELPAETLDGFKVTIKANIEFLDEIASVLDYGAEGIGLFRTEFLYLQRKELPSEDTLFEAYKYAAQRLYPHPVTIRTLDIGGDKFVSNISLGEEKNPNLGLRAIRLCLREPELFRTQLRAILRASAFGNIQILFPLISGHRQTMLVKKYIQETKEELKARGEDFDPNIKIGLMIEVPTAVAMADILAREVDFFSIGTNDLIQYSLAIDRVNEHVAYLYEPLHPGILRMIYQTATAARNAGIEVAMCGEMAGEMLYVPILIGLGLDELSMHPRSIPRVKQMIRQSNHEKCTALIDKVLKARTAPEIRELLKQFIKDNYRGVVINEEDGDIFLIEEEVH